MPESSFKAFGLKSLADLIFRLEREAADHAAWIVSVTAKLRAALGHAAAGEPFEWEQLGPDPQFPLLPESLGLAPSQKFTWPGPVYPGWPEPPGPDATYAEIKRYACIQVIAEAYLQSNEEATDLPEVLRLSPSRAWTLAESVYEAVYGTGPDERWDPYGWQPYRPQPAQESQ